MQKWKLKGVASLLVVLMLAASAIALFAPGSGNSAVSKSTAIRTQSAASGGNTFQVALLTTTTGTSFAVPTNANVTLTNTHNPSIRYTLNYSTTYSASGVPSGKLVPGYYTVSASAPGYFSGTLPQPVAFNNTVSVRTANLVLYKIDNTPSNTHSVTVTVTGQGYSSGIQGAYVQFVETTWANGTIISKSLGEFNQTVASGYTDAAGQVTLQISSLYNYDMIASVNNSNSSLSSYFAPYSAVVSGASIPATISAPLPLAYDLGGVVSTSSGTLATNVTGYLLSYASPSVPLQLRFFHATITAYFYNFYVENGTYAMVINSSGEGSYLTDVTVSGSTTQDVQLSPKLSSGFPASSTDIAYASGTPNWNYVNISYAQSLDAGTSIASLPYSYVPSVAMQLALAFNGGYPAVNASTLTAAQAAVAGLGPEYVTTYNLLSVNSTNYLGGNSYTSVLSGVKTGALSTTSAYYYNITDSYRTLSSIPANVSSYSVVLLANYNTTEMQFIYTLTVPTGFQLSSNSSTGPFGPVTVVGHTTITVYGTTTGYGYATVTMSVSVGQTPVVKAAAVTGAYAFAYSKSGSVQYYIVRAETAVNYTAQGSYDPSGGPLLYSWHWDNSSLPSSYTNNTYQTVVNHSYANYTTPGQFMYVTLTATTVTGHSANTTIQVRVANDTTLSAQITAVGKTIYSGRLYANQSTPITVNGLGSKASISPGDNQGTVISYNFSWGDGVKNYTVFSYTATNLNVSHSYYSPGNYTMNLTVTDEVGYTATTSVTVQVNKTLKPIVSFLVYNSAWKSAGGSVRENTTVHFNASATSDPNFAVSSLLFEWDFGDAHNTTNASTLGNTLYSRYQNITGSAGTNVSHIYTYISSTPVSVKLTVVDPAGNKATYTYNMTVTSQPRPDLRIINISFSPRVFTQGSSGTINVTLINIGSANASLSKVNLVAINAQSGNKITIGSISTFYNGTEKNTASSIAPNETVFGIIHWSPPSFGNFTIQATSTAPYQLQSSDNTMTQPISINQSQLQVYALYIGIIVIIVAIVAVIALRRRMPRRKGYEKGQPPKRK